MEDDSRPHSLGRG